MRICFADEAGCTGVMPVGSIQIQPAFVLLGLIFEQSSLLDLTNRFLFLKKQYFPHSRIHDLPVADFLDWVLVEIKGADLRRHAGQGGKRLRRHAMSFMDEVLKLLESLPVKIVGRVWIKSPGAPFQGRSVYTSSVQYLCDYFQNSLQLSDDDGLVILDSRRKNQNSNVAHSIFTGRHSYKGNRYANLVEQPVFGHSDNHAGTQICDIICSGIVFPMAVHRYCGSLSGNIHLRPGYEQLCARFAKRIEKLQHRYLSSTGKWTGGIVTADALGQMPGSRLFQ